MKKATITVFLSALSILSCNKESPLPKPISVESVRLDATEAEVKVGETFILTATVLPENAANKNVKWSSGNSEVAAVGNDGTVTGLAAGKAEITVTTEDGYKSATCSVTVTSKGPDEALPGVFSVSESKTVRFSRGNLYYDGSAFQFETNQYDVPDGISASHLGYFFWSTSARVATADSYKDPTPSAPTDILFTNASADTPNPEFCAGGNEGTYRALSSAEWQYLLKTRMNAAVLSGKGITVCKNTNCLVIAPDNFIGKIEETYDATAWKEAEVAGLVCIPAAGYRDGSNIVNAGSNGYYWASTSSYGGISANVTFSGTFITPASYALRSIAYPLRLVKD